MKPYTQGQHAHQQERNYFNQGGKGAAVIVLAAEIFWKK